MSKYLLIFMILSITKCGGIKDCYSGKHSKVVWNEKNKNFENVVMNVDESMVFMTIDSCRISKSDLYITGRIANDSMVLNPNLSLHENVLLLKCDSKGVIQDTLLQIHDKGYFKVHIKRNNGDYVVVKEFNKGHGFRYDL